MITECPIRLAGAADARDIARLSREAIEYGLAWSWTPRRVMASIDDAASNWAERVLRSSAAAADSRS